MRNWGRSTTTLLLTTALCLGSSASSSAQQTSITTNLLGKAQVMKKGARARVAGILIERKTLLKILKHLESRARKAEAAAARAKKDATALVEAERKVTEIMVKSEVDKYDACRADAIRRDAIYERALKRCSASTPFWKSPVLWTAIGAAVGGGVCGLGVGASR